MSNAIRATQRHYPESSWSKVPQMKLDTNVRFAALSKPQKAYPPLPRFGEKTDDPDYDAFLRGEITREELNPRRTLELSELSRQDKALTLKPAELSRQDKALTLKPAELPRQYTAPTPKPVELSRQSAALTPKTIEGHVQRLYIYDDHRVVAWAADESWRRIKVDRHYYMVVQLPLAE